MPATKRLRTRLKLMTMLALVPLATMTACGSSADFGAGGQTSVGDTSLGGDGSSVLTPTAPGALPSAGPGGESLAPGATPTDSGASGTLSSGDSGYVPPGGSPTSTLVETSPIRLSYVVEDAAGASALTGTSVSGSDSGSEQTMNALVAYANAHGGVGGRKIIATANVIEATSEDSARLTDCKAMTEDQKAQVVIDENIFLEADDWSCFAQAHAAYFGTVTGVDRTFLASTAPYINTTWIALDRTERSMVSAAVTSGFFSKGTKLGLILSDDPIQHRDYTDIMEPALAAAGITKPVVRYLSGSTAQQQATQATNAEVSFSAAGVNRIFFLQNILGYLAFTNEADAEHYYPEYEYTDLNGMTGVAAYYGKSNKQNINAIAISANSVADSATPVDTSAPINRNSVTPGQRQCLDLLTAQTKKDYYDPSKSGDTLDSWVYYCDEFLLWWHSAQKIGAAWTPADSIVGLKALGTGYESSLQHSVSFVSGHDDGGSSYRIGRWNGSCGCFVKISDWISLPT